jgi:hypothetical protein
MQTIFPGLIVQQQTNTLAMRQIIPQGPGLVSIDDAEAVMWHRHSCLCVEDI